MFAALNDCLYRNMKTVQYLIMMDLDELIIPYQVGTYYLEKWSDGVVAGSDRFLSQSIIIRISSKTVLKPGGAVSMFLCFSVSMLDLHLNHFHFLQSPSLTDLLADLRRRTMVQAGRQVAPQQVSSYSFQNAFFYLQWPDTPFSSSSSSSPSSSSSSTSSAALTALRKTRRRQKLHPPKQRSKYICRPTAVKEVR